MRKYIEEYTKKYLTHKNLPFITLGAGLLGFILRLWQLNTRTDAGFILRGHISGILLAILTAIFLVAVALASRPLVQANKYDFNFPASVYGGYKEHIGEKQLWPKKILDGWLKLVDEAYEAIEPMKESDPEMYAVYSEHILLESMFPRYALLNFYKGSYSEEAFYRDAFQFKLDCGTLGMTKWREGSSIDEIFTQWGV